MAMKKSNARRGFHIPRFYVIYLAVTVSVILIIIASLGIVSNRLAEYEDAQPKYVASEIFARYFEPSVNYDALLDDARYDREAGTREALKMYLINEIGESEVTYSASSASEDEMKYIVRAGSKQLASIILKASDEKTEHGYTQYEFSYIELFINTACGSTNPPETEEQPKTVTLYFDVPSGYTVTVDGTALTGENITQKHMNKDAIMYFPPESENTEGLEFSIYMLNTLEAPPEKVTVTDAEGNEAEVKYNAETRTYTAGLAYSKSLADEYSEFVTAAMTDFAAFGQGAQDKSLLGMQYSGHFDLNSTANEKLITQAGALWTIWAPSSYDFADIEIGEFYKFSDDVFSCHISFKLLLERDGQSFSEIMDYYVFLHNVDGQFLIYDWFNA